MALYPGPERPGFTANLIMSLPIFRADRVCEAAVVTGQGTAIKLGGATPGNRGFLQAGISDGQPVIVCVNDPIADVFEARVCSYAAATNTLQYTALISSTTDLSINFAGNACSVFIDVPASSLVTVDNFLVQMAQIGIFPVTAYGAYFDGVRDDYPGITAAIAAAAAAGGGRVIFPCKQGLLSSTVVNSFNNVSLEGTGGGLLIYNSLGGFVTPQTRLTWTGAVGGTMFEIGAPNNATPSGTRVVNCPVKGILADGAMIAAFGWDIRSVSQTDFGVISGMQCLDTNVNIGTSWLAPTTGSAAGEACDTQGNYFPLIYSSHRGSLISTTVASGGTSGTSSSTIQVASTSGFVVGMQVQVGSTMVSITSSPASTRLRVLRPSPSRRPSRRPTTRPETT